MHLLGNGIFSSFNFPEQFLRITVVKRELPVQHCVEQHSHGPHITGFATIWLTCVRVCFESEREREREREREGRQGRGRGSERGRGREREGGKGRGKGREGGRERERERERAFTISVLGVFGHKEHL